MLMLVLQIGMLVMGLIALFSGKLSLTKAMTLKGAAARLAGLIMIAPLPINLGVGFVVGLTVASQGRQFNFQEWQMTFILLEVGVTLGCLLIAFLVAATMGAPDDSDESKYRRRDRDGDDGFTSDRPRGGDGFTPEGGPRGQDRY